MPRANRFDEPGLLHHVMNRGIARRTVFESAADVRKFLALLTCASRRARIKVYAYTFMLSHFHLLVRSLDGQLSETMRLVQNSYVRWFNRSRHRDGPLFRGRFLSHPILSRSHERTIIRYIDQNPVDARIVAQPHLFPFGSAREVRSGHPRRKCLSMELIDWHKASMPFVTGTPEEVYDALYGPRLSPEQVAWVERRTRSQPAPQDGLDGLLESTPQGVLAWARQRARIGDGTQPGAVLVAAETVDTVIEDADTAPWSIVLKGARPRSAWPIVHAALLACLAGESNAGMATRIRCSATHAARLLQAHVQAVALDAAYADRFAHLARLCLLRVHASTESGEIPTSGCAARSHGEERRGPK